MWIYGLGCLLHRLTDHSSGFFSVLILPTNQDISIERQKKDQKAIFKSVSLIG